MNRFRQAQFCITTIINQLPFLDKDIARINIEFNQTFLEGLLAAFQAMGYSSIYFNLLQLPKKDLNKIASVAFESHKLYEKAMKKFTELKISQFSKNLIQNFIESITVCRIYWKC